MTFTTVACQSFFLRRVVEMEKELNKIKSKYVTLLSDKFKITLPSEFLGPLAVGGGLLVILCLPSHLPPLILFSYTPSLARCSFSFIALSALHSTPCILPLSSFFLLPLLSFSLLTSSSSSLPPLPPPDPTGQQELEEDPEEDKYSNELLMLIKQEGGDNPVFDSYMSKFEDQYGDLHDWQTGTTTHHYLCRELYLHYTQAVRPATVLPLHTTVHS